MTNATSTNEVNIPLGALIEPAQEPLATPVPENIVTNIDVLGYLKDTDLLKSPTSQKFVGKTADDLMRSYINLEQVMGKKINNYSTDELSIIDGLRGIPKSSDDYQMPEGLSTEDSQWFKDQALKAGLTKNGALELVTAYNERIEASKVDAANKALDTNKQELDTLRKMYGNAYEQRIALANQAAEQLGGPGLLETLVNAGLGANPVVIDALSKAGMMMSESKIPASRHSQAYGVSKEDAKRQIELTLADPDLRQAYYNKFHAKHKLVTDDMRKLYEIAYNE